ncbi:MAG: TIGR04076 family protein [Candidatus Aminicenantes bacterium]|nr:TIGR04076 family protein [Candidatus Aminicenantes bacterium]
MIRRDFCKTLPCAALGAVATLSVGKNSTVKEADMAKKVTAVKAKVLSVKGTCSLGHKVGDVVTFTETGVQGKICIHALYSMMPAVFAMLYDAQFPWLEDKDKKTHPCTDAANPVVFEIAKVREG